MSLLRPSRLATMLGSEQDPRSPRTYLRERLRSRGRGRSTRKDTVESPTTELPRLPGLEVPELQVTHPSGERGRWIERGPSGKLMLFSGRSNPELAHRIADQLNIELGEVELETFENGETYCRFRESIRGADVFIVQSCHGRATNDLLLELVIMIQAAKLASANHITALPLFAQYYRDKGLYGEGVVVVSPDPGRAKMATKFAEMLEAEFALMRKTRPAHDVAAVTEVSGRVAGKTAIMTDDIIVTGGTLIAGAQALREAGATEVYACATHALIPDGAFEKLGKSELREIAVTDTVPVNPLNRPENLPRPLTVSLLLADTIKNVFSDESVSAIFAGENQLF